MEAAVPKKEPQKTPNCWTRELRQASLRGPDKTIPSGSIPLKDSLKQPAPSQRRSKGELRPGRARAPCTPAAALSAPQCPLHNPATSPLLVRQGLMPYPAPLALCHCILLKLTAGLANCPLLMGTPFKSRTAERRGTVLGGMRLGRMLLGHAQCLPCDRKACDSGHACPHVSGTVHPGWGT
uniref:Uncharacterized protein n=1 Tax=Sphaerodactylus townsendi TaxID=933632 RepID=A0ACB8EB41_9SAUR